MPVLYDAFAGWYDAMLEPVYRDERRAAAALLDPHEGMVLLDVPTGTGASLPVLTEGLSEATVIAVDASAAMLRQLARRDFPEGIRVVPLAADARALTSASLAQAVGAEVVVDRIHVFLGTTVFEDMAGTLEALWALLAPGGRIVIVDVYAASPGLQGRIVQCMAGADLGRQAWTWLTSVAPDADVHWLDPKPAHGGAIWAATGTRPVERVGDTACTNRADGVQSG